MNMINRNEVLLKSKNEWLYYANPCEILIAETLKDIRAALHDIEKKVEDRGLHAAGFLSYEAASAFDPALLTHPGDGFPYLWFGLYSSPQLVTLPEPAGLKIALDWKPTVDQNSYETTIDRIKAYIAQGKTYQVNYTMRLKTEFCTDPWEFFLHLAQTQNEHAAYVDTGRYVICSASPELFFELDGEKIFSRPMKGTIGRGRTTQEDQEQREKLRNSKKDRAENVMIVDMIRNDLGRIATAGNVQVPELFTTERYPTLWQMTSTVAAQTNASLAGILGALFPCASITGAPKVSTMKIIQQLESTPRRIYTGTIGCFSPGRKASFNVAIRTALIDRQSQEAEYGIGGGIVWDSNSQAEFEEAMIKARVLTEPAFQFSLIETMLWTPEEGFFLKQKHMERLLDSAEYFGFTVSKETVEEKLRAIASNFVEPQRVRLLLAPKGDIQVTSVPHFAEKKPASVSLAKKAVSANERFLFHKTTRREIYDKAKAGYPDRDDVLLYNEFGELTEFTIGNLVVELDGELVTPPIASGLLPGTFRAYLIETGQVVERALPLPRLKDCAKIYRVNSVRKWETVIIS